MLKTMELIKISAFHIFIFQIRNGLPNEGAGIGGSGDSCKVLDWLMEPSLRSHPIFSIRFLTSQFRTLGAF